MIGTFLWFTPCERETRADFLARLGAMQPKPLAILEAPPGGLGMLLDGDARRVQHLRA